MAESEAHKSFWQEVQLSYPDGFTFSQVLDQNIIKRLENGDEELLAEIRKNYEESQTSTVATECTDFHEDEASDVEDISASTSLSWSREATDQLIDLYEEHEEKMEDPRRKKKDIWKLITEGLNNAGFKFSQTKVEGKWRSLIASHKTLRDNKTKTGQKRKTFQYFERIDAILSKRHDVNPSFLSGSGVNTSTATKFSTKVENSQSASQEEKNEFKPDTDSSTSDTERKAASETCQGNGKKSLSSSACRRREKRKLDSTSESGSYKICELPLHILKTIFEFVERDDLSCKLYLVCKKFRNLVYLTRNEMIIHISALTNDCGMKLMPDLKKVTIIGLYGGQKTSDVQPIINLFDNVNFQKLENLILKGFCLENNFFQLLCSLSLVKLLVLKLVFCDNRTVGELKCILEKIPTLKYCDVECNMETVLDYHVFAEIANELVGQVNLNLNTLEMVPSSLLRHARAEYRAKWPTGQLFLGLNMLNFY